MANTWQASKRPSVCVTPHCLRPTDGKGEGEGAEMLVHQLAFLLSEIIDNKKELFIGARDANFLISGQLN